MKNIKRFIISLAVLTGIGLITQSCFEDLNDFTYDGPPVVEFSNLSHEEASWTSVGAHWSAVIEGDHQDAAIQVALVGPHQAEDKEISYYVADQLYRDTDANRLRLEQPEHDEWELMETTAVEGVDYNIQDGGMITIPANNSFGSLSMELTPTDDVELFIVLEERDLEPSQNYKFFRLNIVPEAD